MSEYNLGTAKGTIEIDYRGTGVDQANEDLRNTSRHASSADESLQKTGRAAGLAGLAITAGLGLAVKSAADFEKGLSGIEAVSGATAGEMEQVRKKALQLGADTAFSASEASTAMEELVKAGISIPDVLNGAADATVALAAAGGVALPEAATIASNAMNQFGLTADQLPGIVDRIAGAANTSAIDVSDLGQSMSQAGAVANLAGLSFDDTALAIAAMGNAGIKGSDAGTSLKTMLQNLQPQTEKQIGLMKDLGLVTEDGANKFFDANGSVKSMAEIGGVLEGALKGMSDAQKTATLETLFGSDAIRAAAVIADTGAAGFAKMNAEMNKTSAADVAKTRMGNLSGQIEALKGSAETLAIQLGSVLIPVFNKIVTALTQAVNWFTNLSDGQQKFLVIALASAAGLLLLVAGLIKLVAFAKTVKATILGVKAAMIALNATFLTNPIFLIIAAIVALIAGLVLLYKKNETFRNFVNAAWAGIKAAISAVVSWITGTAVPWIVNAWNTIVEKAQSLWASIVSVWNSIKSAISTAMTAISTVVSTIWNTIVTVVTTYINVVRTIITTVLNGIMAVWNGIWSLFGPLVIAVWDLIKAIVQVGIYFIKTIITTYLNAIKAFWTTVWNAIKTVVTTVWNAISSFVTGALNKLNSTVASVMGKVRSVWTSVWNAIKAFAQSVWNAIYSVIEGPLNRIRSVVSSVVNGVKSTVTSGFNAAKSAATSAFNSMKNAVVSAIEAVLSRVRSVVASIKGVFSGAGSWLYNAGKQIIQGLINGIKAMVGKVSSAISGVADKIRGFLPGSPIKEGPLREHGWNQGRPGKLLVRSLAEGVESDMDVLSRAFSGINPTISPSLTTRVPSGLSGRFSDAPAPVAAPTGATYQISVSIDPKDLDGIRSVQDFVERIDMLVPMRDGVNA